MLFIIICFIIFSYFVRKTSGLTKNLNFEKITNNWEYCEGDSWMGKLCSEENSWKTVKFPGTVPLSSREVRNLWIRILIPKDLEKVYKDFTLYLTIGYTLEIYFKEKKFFGFGEFYSNGKGNFNGFNHQNFVRLPEGISGSHIYIRVYSNWIRTEVLDEPLFGNYSDLVFREFISQIDVLIISIFYFIFGFFALIVYRKEQKFKSFLFLGVISLLSGCAGIYLAEFKKHIYDEPLIYTRIFTLCLYALGPAIHLYIISLFGNGYKSSFKITTYLYIPVFIISIIFSYIEDRNLYYFMETGFVILSTFGLVNILLHMIYFIRNGNNLAVYFGFGFASIVGSVISMILYSLKFTDYYGNSYLLGYFGFFLGIVFASGEEYFQSKKKLEEYTQNLEKIIQNKTEEIERKNLILFKEEKKILTLEKQNAIVKERESLFADIHDNLGGKLLDLSIQLNNIQTNKEINEQSKNKISKSMNEILKGLRSRLLIFEDMHQIEENFAEGLNSFIVRRYSQAKRKVNYTVGENFKEGIIAREDYSNLLNMITELVNNDLKYGFGVSNWKLNLVNNKVLVTLRTETNWKEGQVSTGNGQNIIRKRAEEIGGKLIEKISKGKYEVEIGLSLS